MAVVNYIHVLYLDGDSLLLAATQKHDTPKEQHAVLMTRLSFGKRRKLTETFRFD